MAIQLEYEGIIITRINNIGSDATPNRVVVLDSTDPDGFDVPSAAGVLGLGVLKKDLRYNSGVVPDGSDGSIVISGVINIECASAVTAWHYVGIADTTGRIKDLGAVDSLSVGSSAVTNITGVALEAGTEGSYAAIWLMPHPIFLA